MYKKSISSSIQEHNVQETIPKTVESGATGDVEADSGEYVTSGKRATDSGAADVTDYTKVPSVIELANAAWTPSQHI